MLALALLHPATAAEPASGVAARASQQAWLHRLPWHTIAPRLPRLPQIHYRMGNNKEAIERYSQLFRSHGAASREVQTNVVAAYVAGGRSGEVPAVMEAMKVCSRARCGSSPAHSVFCSRTQPAVGPPSRLHWRDQGRLGGGWQAGQASTVQRRRPTDFPGCPCTFCTAQISAQESFELAFNTACGLLETGRLADAQQQLQLAVRVGASLHRSTPPHQRM